MVTASKRSIATTLAELKEQGRAAFIPFLVAGDPSPAATVAALQKLDEAGADVIELGVPTAEPSADGPTIRAADARALRAGTTFAQVLAILRQAGALMRAPILVFAYCCELLACGGAPEFCRQIRAAGAAGLLVPDAPPAELPGLQAAAAAQGLELVLVVSPATPEAELAQRARNSQGFVYLASVAGPTGMRQAFDPRIERLIERLHALTTQPVCVGFGVSGPEQARQLRAWGADGVICGSALVAVLGEAPSEQEGMQRLGDLARSLRQAI